MKSTFIILLIGAFVAFACAAPSRSSLKASLQNDGDKRKALKQMDNDGGDLLIQALLDRIQKQVALKQEVSTEEDEEEDDDDGDDLLSQALLDQVALEKEVSTEEDEDDDDNDDDDDDGDKAASQIIHFHFG